jgi:hypothetical protein
MSSERTVLLCPKCGNNLAASITTHRILDFSDDEYGPRGLFAEGPRQYWGIPGGDDDGDECSDLTCNDTDCECKHNYDPQKNKELLEDPTVDKVFQYDWDYQEEYQEDVEKVIKIYCPVYSCDYSHTVTQQMSSHITMENVG